MARLTYKLDKTKFSSQFGTYQVFQTWEVPVSISGSIPNLYYNLYQARFTFPNDNAKGRCFIQKSNGSLKAALDVGYRLQNYSPTYEIYDFTSSETFQTGVHYEDSGETLVVSLAIVNQTGGSISLVTQTLDIIVELYDSPVA